VVEADIFFEKEEDTKEYNKYLQACIPEAQKTAYNDLESFQPYNTPIPTAVNRALISLTFCLHHLLFGFETVNNFCMRELIWLVKLH
jgi:hypothetical protein